MSIVVCARCSARVKVGPVAGIAERAAEAEDVYLVFRQHSDRVTIEPLCEEHVRFMKASGFRLVEADHQHDPDARRAYLTGESICTVCGLPVTREMVDEPFHPILLDDLSFNSAAQTLEARLVRERYASAHDPITESELRLIDGNR